MGKMIFSALRVKHNLKMYCIDNVVYVEYGEYH